MHEQFYIIHYLYKDYIEEINRLKDEEIKRKKEEKRSEKNSRTTQSREDYSPSSQQYDLDIDDIEDIAGGLI